MRPTEGLYLLLLSVSTACWLSCRTSPQRAKQIGFAQFGSVVTLLALLALLNTVRARRALPRWQLWPSILAIPLVFVRSTPVLVGITERATHSLFGGQAPETAIPPERFDALMEMVMAKPPYERDSWYVELPKSAARRVVYREDQLWDDRGSGKLVKLIKFVPRRITFDRPAISTMAVALLLICLSGLMCYLLPLPYFDHRLPVASSKFAHVGLCKHELQLPDHVLKADPKMAGGSGKFPVHVYYPSAHSGQMPYADQRTCSALARAADFPGLLFSHLSQLLIDCAHCSPPLHPDASRCPCVVFSHGLSGLPCVYWALISSLVRAGYIVVCPIHNDGSAALVTLQDGTVCQYQTRQQLVGTKQKITEADSPELQEIRREQLRRRVAEARAALTWAVSEGAAEASRAQRWAGAIDTERLGYIGHSFVRFTLCTCMTELPTDF
jgi:hypothetical protein